MRQSELVDMAFDLERGAELREKWYLIPAHVDVLITYGPPISCSTGQVRIGAVGRLGFPAAGAAMLDPVREGRTRLGLSRFSPSITTRRKRPVSSNGSWPGRAAER